MTSRGRQPLDCRAAANSLEIPGLLEAKQRMEIQALEAPVVCRALLSTGYHRLPQPVRRSREKPPDAGGVTKNILDDVTA